MPRVAGLAAALALTAAAPAAAGESATCRGGDGPSDRTYAKNRFVHVYSKWDKSGDGDGKLVGCRRSDGAKRTLVALRFTGFRETTRVAGRVRLNRHMVGYEQIESYPQADVAPTATRLASWNSRTLNERFDAYHQRRTRNLVVTRTGGLAWVEVDPAGDAAVRAVDGAGVRTLDSGPVHDLGVELTIVSWFNGDEERFARQR